MEVDAEEDMQEGFNYGFVTASALTKILGEAKVSLIDCFHRNSDELQFKGILTATMVILNLQKKRVPDEISSSIANIDAKMEDSRASLNSLTETGCNELLENAIFIRNKNINSSHIFLDESSHCKSMKFY